jgi:aarF domain-containing kinase
MLRLCLTELYEWKYMQTDPNWSNFLYDAETKKMNLIDFGASRSFSPQFVDKYIRIIRAAANNDRNEIIRWSRETGFLTGYESKVRHHYYLREGHFKLMDFVLKAT